MKLSMLFVTLMVACLIESNHGQSLIAGSKFSEACDIAAQLLSRGKSIQSVNKIVTDQLDDFIDSSGQKVKKPLTILGKPELGYGGQYSTSQQGMANFNANNLMSIVVSALTCYRGSNLPLTDVCPLINLPEQINLDDSVQMDFLVKQLKSNEMLTLHKCSISPGTDD